MLQPSVAMETEDNSNKMWQQLAEVITPSIVKVVDFAKNVPGFEMVCIMYINYTGLYSTGIYAMFCR